VAVVMRAVYGSSVCQTTSAADCVRSLLQLRSQQLIFEVIFGSTLCRTIHGDRDWQECIPDLSSNRLELSAEWRAVVKQFVYR